jgi:hypothetical protein
VSIERMITTDMSARIVQDLLKRRWTAKRIARAIGAPVAFVNGVRAGKQVLTLGDIRQLAAQSDQTAPLMILNSIVDVPRDLQLLFDATRESLLASAGLRDGLQQPARKRRRRRRASSEAA